MTTKTNFIPENEAEAEISPVLENQPEAENSPAEFVPMPIYFDSKKAKSIRNRYEQLCGDLNFFLSEFSHLTEGKQPNLEEVVAFLSVSDPEQYLKIAYIEKNEIRFPGLNVQKIVALNLFDLPAGYLGDIEQAVISHKNLWESLIQCRETNFEYPLLEMYFQDKEGTIFFDLDAVFETKVTEFCTLWTECEAQNRLLPVYQKMIDALNELNSMDESLLNFDGHGKLEILKLKDFVSVSRGEGPVIVINHVKFWHYYRSRDERGRKLYKFPEVIPGLFQGLTEPDRYKVRI